MIRLIAFYILALCSLALCSLAFSSDLLGQQYCRYDTIEILNDSTIIIEEDCLNFIGNKTCVLGVNSYEVTESLQSSLGKVLYQKYLGCHVTLNEVNSGYYFSGDTLHISWIESKHALNNRGMESLDELSIPRQKPLVKKRLFILIDENRIKDITTGWIYNKIPMHQ